MQQTVNTTDLFGFVGAATTVIDVVTEHGFVHALTTAVAAHVVVRTLPPTYSVTFSS